MVSDSRGQSRRPRIHEEVQGGDPAWGRDRRRTAGNLHRNDGIPKIVGPHGGGSGPARMYDNRDKRQGDPYSANERSTGPHIMKRSTSPVKSLVKKPGWLVPVSRSRRTHRNVILSPPFQAGRRISMPVFAKERSLPVERRNPSSSCSASRHRSSG